MRLSNKEREVMALLWNSDAPMTAAEIVEVSENRSWKENSIYIIIKSLVDKGAAAYFGLKPTATNNARTLKPVISAEDYALSIIEDFKKGDTFDIKLDVDILIDGIRSMKQ